MRISWLRGCAVAVAATVLAAGSVSAHDVVVHDPANDSDTIDTQSVLYRHDDGRTTLKITFYDPLKPAQLDGDDDVEWWLYTVGDDKQGDFIVHFFYRPDPAGWVCAVEDIRNDANQIVRTVTADKRKYSLKCSFRSRLVSGIADRFVVNAYSEGGYDFTPDNGSAKHS